MKKLLTIFLLYIPILSVAQLSASEKLEYIEVIEINNNKETLFKNAKTWIATNFGNYQKVLQFEDKDAGKIIVKGTKSVRVGLTKGIRFTMTVDVKDSKYRLSFTDIDRILDLSDPVYLPMSKDPNVDYYNKLNKDIDEKIRTTSKKKTLKELSDEKLSNENAISEEIKLNSMVSESIQMTQASFKKSMESKDDF